MMTSFTHVYFNGVLASAKPKIGQFPFSINFKFLGMLQFVGIYLGSAEMKLRGGKNATSLR